MKEFSPQLRNGLEIPLQTAFQEQNWHVVARLAEKRTRTCDDPYFEILKAYAESQLDEPDSKFAALGLVNKYVQEGIVLKDFDAFELLNCSTLKLINPDTYAATLGPLQVRAVKALPKNKYAALRSLKSCLLYYDLISAQQIAAITDKAFPGERVFFFWNVIITHLLVLDRRVSSEKKTLFASLAQKQIERAAKLTEVHARDLKEQSPESARRGIDSEEEVLLLYQVVLRHGSNTDIERLLSSDVFGPLPQFRLGRKELIIRLSFDLWQRKDWVTLFRITKDCLIDVEKNGQVFLGACDGFIWRYFINAAAQLQSKRPEVKHDVQHTLLEWSRVEHLQPVQKRSISIARLLASFDLDAGVAEDVQDGRPTSLRIKDLIEFIDQQKASLSCFDDISCCVQRLSAEGLRFIAYDHVPHLAHRVSQEEKETGLKIQVLALKLQYLSCLKTPAVSKSTRSSMSRCMNADHNFGITICRPCFEELAERAAGFLRCQRLASDPCPIDDNGILPELAILVALCNLQLAFDVQGEPCSQNSFNARLYLKALLCLEDQWRVTPQYCHLSLMLVRLHLLIGSAHRALEIWNRLAVKRTVIDSLAPVFFDRLSSISPLSLSSSDISGRDIIEAIHSHYATSLQETMSKHVIEAFEAGAFGSVCDIFDYYENLRFSCTRLMGVTEKRRADRMLGLPSMSLHDLESYTEIFDEKSSRINVDEGSFPTLYSNIDSPLRSHLRSGPPLSAARCRLMFLSETFYDLINDELAVQEMMDDDVNRKDSFSECVAQIVHKFPKHLHSAAENCSAGEGLFFETTYLLCALVLSWIEYEHSDHQYEQQRQIAQSVQLALQGLRDRLLISGEHSIPQLIIGFWKLHDTAMLCDTALLARKTAQRLLLLGNIPRHRSSQRNKVCDEKQSAILNLVLGEANLTLEFGNKTLTGLTDCLLMEESFAETLNRWLFGENVTGREESIDISGLIESWRRNAAGWRKVKWS